MPEGIQEGGCLRDSLEIHSYLPFDRAIWREWVDAVGPAARGGFKEGGESGKRGKKGRERGRMEEA